MLSGAELDSIVRKMVEEQMEFPAEVHASLVDYAIQRKVQTGDCAGLLSVLCPWGPEGKVFDPEAPKLSALSSPLSRRLEKYKTILFGTHMTQLIQQGLNGVPQTKTMCTTLIAHMEKEDLVEISSPCVVVLEDSVAACRAILSVVDKVFVGASVAALREVLKHKGKTNKSILVSVAAAFDSSPFYNERIHLFEMNESALLHWGEINLKHMEELEHSKDKAISIEGCQRLERMTKDYSKVLVALPPDMLGDFGERLRESLVHMGTTITGSQACNVDADILQAASKSMAEATITFPADNKLNELHSQISEKILQLDRTGRVDALSAFTQAAWETDEASIDGHTQELKELLKSTMGVQLSADLRGSMTKRLEEHLPFVADRIVSHADIALIERCNDQLCIFADRSDDSNAKAALSFTKVLILLRRALDDMNSIGDDPVDATKKSEVAHTCRVRLNAYMREVNKHDEVTKTTGLLGTLVGASVVLRIQVAECVDDYDGRMKSDTEAALQKAFDDLKVATKGKEHGDAWHSVVPHGSSFEALCLAAKDTIMGLDGKDLGEKRMAVCDAIAKFTLVRESAGSDQKSDLVADATRLADFALVARAEVLLMHHLTTETNHELLAKKVRAEILELRAAKMKEKEQFHNALFKRALTALSARSST